MFVIIFDLGAKCQPLFLRLLVPFSRIGFIPEAEQVTLFWSPLELH
jgi:hypothetical protein